jgi:hypothetical protein
MRTRQHCFTLLTMIGSFFYLALQTWWRPRDTEAQCSKESSFCLSVIKNITWLPRLLCIIKESIITLSLLPWRFLLLRSYCVYLFTEICLRGKRVLVGDHLLLRDFWSYGVIFMNVCVVTTVVNIMLLRDFWYLQDNIVQYFRFSVNLNGQFTCYNI